MDFYQINKEYNAKLSTKIYHDLEEFVYNNSVQIIEIVPLDNFNSDIQIASLDNEITIRKITDSERELFLQPRPSLLLEQRILSWRYIIQRIYHTQKLLGPNAIPLFEKRKKRLETENIISKIQTALRLFKAGPVCIAAIIAVWLS